MADTTKTTYLPSEMAEEIRGIQESLNKIYTNKQSVNFYDYDGSLLYSYSPEAFLSLTEMPPNPSYEGLIAQGWNWSLQDAKDYVAEHRALTAGQMYGTDDGKTRIYVRLDRSVIVDAQERAYYSSQVGYIEPPYTGDIAQYESFSFDSDFYDFYLDISFSYEDDGNEHSWPERQACALIDWGDGSTQYAWVSGSRELYASYPGDIPYNEFFFRARHRFGLYDNKPTQDYVITIELLHDFWRGRLSFSSNSFGDEKHMYGFHQQNQRANSPQFIRKIELGDRMDLATHPDILKPGGYYELVINELYEPKSIIYWPFPFVNKTVLSFSSDEFLRSSFSLDDYRERGFVVPSEPSPASGYLYVQFAIAKEQKFDENLGEFVNDPIDFKVEDLKIASNMSYSNAYSLKPLSDWNADDESFAQVFSDPSSLHYVATASYLGYVTDTQTVMSNLDNSMHFVDRLYEITGELPSTIDLTIEYPFDGQMACAIRRIPKIPIPYSWDNYLYNLESVTLPQGLKTLGSVCFKNSYILKHVTVPAGITEIPSAAFANDYSLRSLSLPSSIQSIGVQALHGCRALTDVSIPDTLISVGAGAFSGCDGLSDFTNLANVLQGVSYQDTENAETIPEDLLSDCGDVNEVTIPSTTMVIADRAFKNCRSLKTVNIPSTLEEIGEEAFCGCTSLVGDSIDLSGFHSIDLSGVHSIGKSAFKGCRLLKVMRFPSGLQVIPTSVCEDCQSLCFVFIPLSVTTVEDRAFYDCKSLLSVVFQSNGVTEIGDYAFSGCQFAMFETDLTHKVLPNWLDHIGKRAFEKTSLRSVEIPSPITELNEGTFSECKLLETVTFARDTTFNIYRITKIGPYAFYDTLLTKITIPDSVTEIGAYAFAKCWRLANVTLSSNLSSIAGHLLESTAIVSIQLPSNITEIGAYAFADCQRLKSITLPSNVASIGAYSFSGCANLEAINIPDIVTQIEEGTFKGGKSLASITIPSSVMRIGDYAFAVGNDASLIKGNLESIAFLSLTPPVVDGEHAWEGISASCIIHVPANRLEAYTSASNYPDPTIYTYIADQPDNSASIDGSALVLSGPSAIIADEALELTDDFAEINDDDLILNAYA